MVTPAATPVATPAVTPGATPVATPMSMPAATPEARPALIPGLPPLPVVDEARGLWSFLAHGIDDLVEDVAKVACLGALYLSGASTTRVAMAGSPSAILASAAGSGLALAGYPACNEVADFVADQVDPRESNHSQHPNETSPARLIDDVAEDAFKGACVVSHYWVGKLISGRYIMPVALALAGYRKSALAAASSSSSSMRFMAIGVVAVVVSVLEVLIYFLAAATMLGNAAKYYNSCNDYGDVLGDYLQRLAVASGTA